jgi:hypothetical protein
MKRVFVFSILFLALAIIQSSQLKAQTLVAEVNQKSVPFLYQKDLRWARSVDMDIARCFDPDFMQVYLSKESVDDVREFYKLKHQAEVKPGYIFGGVPGTKSDWTFSAQLMNRDEIYQITKNAKLIRPCGIQIHANDPAKNPIDHNPRQSVRQILLVELEQIVRAGKHTRAELEALKEKYKPLLTAFFQYTNEMHGEVRLSEDDAIFLKYSKLIYANGAPEFNEKAAEQMRNNPPPKQTAENQPSTPPDAWSLWVKCLDEMQQASYRTLIYISKHPSQWKETQNN